jgi:hypothetical protein
VNAGNEPGTAARKRPIARAHDPVTLSKECGSEGVARHGRPLEHPAHGTLPGPDATRTWARRYPLHFGAAHVTGVDLNPVTHSLLTTHFADFSGRLPDNPRVTRINAERAPS